MWHDPTFKNGPSGWGLHVAGSSNVFVYGAGHYSFFKVRLTSLLVTSLAPDGNLDWFAELQP